MKATILLVILFSIVFSVDSQTNDCYKRLEEAFSKRGSNGVGDAEHEVIISFFDKSGNATCASGKVRVENGQIVSIFIHYDDGTYGLYDKKFYNEKKQFPYITNGISDMISTPDGEKFKVIFINKLKPKAKAIKEFVLPDDL
jgi:hypothetical protein